MQTESLILSRDSKLLSYTSAVGLKVLEKELDELRRLREARRSSFLTGQTTAERITTSRRVSSDPPSSSFPCIPAPRSVPAAVADQPLKPPPRRRPSLPIPQRSISMDDQKDEKPTPPPSPPSPMKSTLSSPATAATQNKTREIRPELHQPTVEQIQESVPLSPSRTPSPPSSVEDEKAVTHEAETAMRTATKAMATPPPSPSPPLTATYKLSTVSQASSQPAAAQRAPAAQTRPKPAPIITSTLKSSPPHPVSSRSTPQVASVSLCKLDSSTSSPATSRRNKDGFIGVKGLAQKFNSLTPTDLAEATSVNEKIPLSSPRKQLSTPVFTKANELKPTSERRHFLQQQQQQQQQPLKSPLKFSRPVQLSKESSLVARKHAMPRKELQTSSQPQTIPAKERKVTDIFSDRNESAVRLAAAAPVPRKQQMRTSKPLPNAPEPITTPSKKEDECPNPLPVYQPQLTALQPPQEQQQQQQQRIRKRVSFSNKITTIPVYRTEEEDSPVSPSTSSAILSRWQEQHQRKLSTRGFWDAFNAEMKDDRDPPSRYLPQSDQAVSPRRSSRWLDKTRFWMTSSKEPKQQQQQQSVKDEVQREAPSTRTWSPPSPSLHHPTKSRPKKPPSFRRMRPLAPPAATAQPEWRFKNKYPGN